MVSDYLLCEWDECCVMMCQDGTNVVTVQRIATDVGDVARFRAGERFIVRPGSARLVAI